MTKLLASAETFDFFNVLGDTSRQIARRYFRTDISVQIKSDTSPVTMADLEIEKSLREIISSTYPTHNLVGEEEGGSIGLGYSWIIDPIDGTKSFACGLPLYGTLVGLLHNGRPVAGMIDIPSLGERWLGDGRIATLNGTRCRTSPCAQISTARLCATDPKMFSGGKAAAFASLSDAVRMRRLGTDCYGYALLAAGHIDIVVEAGLKPYDVMALVPIIEAAGGVVTTWEGEAIAESFRGDIVAAATRELHAHVLTVLSDK